MKKMQRKNELLHNFLDENDLNIKFGNAFTLSQVTGGNGFRSELLGVMLKYPEYCNFNSESTIAFNYRYGSNQHLAITKTNIENPRNREEELLTKCYKMWKEFFHKLLNNKNHERGICMSYGEGIAWARKERGLSQEQFAKEMGIKRYIVSAIETGQREPSELFIQMACDVLEVDEEDLV